MNLITENDENGNTVFKAVASFSVKIVEDQECVIMATVNEALGHTGYTIGKKKLVDLLKRDNAIPMSFRGNISVCPNCDKRVNIGLPIYHGLREFYCIHCGQRFRR